MYPDLEGLKYYGCNRISIKTQKKKYLFVAILKVSDEKWRN
jgi:hypothetical protein